MGEEMLSLQLLTVIIKQLETNFVLLEPLLKLELYFMRLEELMLQLTIPGIPLEDLLLVLAQPEFLPPFSLLDSHFLPFWLHFGSDLIFFDFGLQNQTKRLISCQIHFFNVSLMLIDV